MVCDEADVLLSVVIPTKDRPTLVRGAISVFTAFPKKVEILVVDDGSARDCAETVDDFCRGQANCRYVRSAAPPGAAAARNLGFRLSKGRYVWFFDDDDTVCTDTIGRVLQRLESAPPPREVILLPMSVRCDGRELYRVYPSMTEQSFERYRSRGNVVNTSCAVFPRIVVQTVGGWDETLLGGDDTDLFLRCSKVRGFLCLDADPVQVNVGHAQRFSNEIRKQQWAKLQFLRKHWGDLSLHRKMYYCFSFLVCGSLLNKLLSSKLRTLMNRRFAFDARSIGTTRLR